MCMYVCVVSIDEGISELVKINGCDFLCLLVFMNVDVELEVLERGVFVESLAIRSDRLRSRWLNLFWDEFELNVIEFWMMCNDELMFDGLFCLDFLFSLVW